jgi:DNA-directed RNA polymerase specialized sigma24 family protein
MDALDDGAIGRILHAQFLDGDIEAFDDIYLRFKGKIFNHVWHTAYSYRKFKPDNDLVAYATDRALSDYYRQPEKFNPSLSSLLTYLKNAARKDYINESKKEQRRVSQLVEIEDEVWNTFEDEGADPPDEAELREENDRVNALLREMCNTDEEFTIVRQFFDEVGNAEKCITELGWPPGKESVRRLYKEKDKLMKRLKRNLPKRLGDDLP